MSSWPSREGTCFFFLYSDSIFFVHICHPRDILLSTGLAGYLVDLKISRGVRKLVRTSQVIKENKK
jgi:hypothetical protein